MPRVFRQQQWVVAWVIHRSHWTRIQTRLCKGRGQVKCGSQSVPGVFRIRSSRLDNQAALQLESRHLDGSYSERVRVMMLPLWGYIKAPGSIKIECKIMLVIQLHSKSHWRAGLSHLFLFCPGQVWTRCWPWSGQMPFVCPPVLPWKWLLHDTLWFGYCLPQGTGVGMWLRYGQSDCFICSPTPISPETADKISLANSSIEDPLRILAFIKYLPCARNCSKYFRCI